MADPPSKRSLWDVLQSRLTIVATLVAITGGGGLVGILHQVGVLGGGSPPDTTPAYTSFTFPSFTFSPPTEATLTLSRSSGPPGTVLTVAGTGFDPGETVEIDFSTARVGKVVADGKGAFSATQITIPSDWVFKGQVGIHATGRTSVKSVEEPFTVQ
jgi:hypothetical protein